MRERPAPHGARREAAGYNLAREGTLTIRAILFDLDGTLIDTERQSAEAMARALRHGLGIEIAQPERDFIIGRSWVAIYDHLCRVHGPLAWPAAELIAATAAQREEVFAEVGITILTGAREVVERFRHLPLGIVTGSSRVEAAQGLAFLGAGDAFGVVVASEDVASSKPSPEGYLAAAAHLRVDPGDCLVVEESHAGIAAGLAAGAVVVAVEAGNFAGHDQSAAHHRLATLDQLTLDFVAGL